MARITEECVARIKDSADVVDIIGTYLQLRRAGNSWKACCPFHNEKTPSFHVNPARQSFKCFGCGVGGDAIKFMMMFENIDYPTALRRVADRNGIAIIEEEDSRKFCESGVCGQPSYQPIILLRSISTACFAAVKMQTTSALTSKNGSLT